MHKTLPGWGKEKFWANGGFAKWALYVTIISPDGSFHCTRYAYITLNIIRYSAGAFTFFDQGYTSDSSEGCV
jgi:hypothetical protein